MGQQIKERFSKGALRRLADSLREEASPEALRELERYKDAHIPALMQVLTRLYRLPFAQSAAFSARQKNTGTIVEKLQREREMELSRLQDMVGIRIVLQGGPNEQDHAVRLIVAEFSDANPRTKDRRNEPSNGYRAVHIIVKVGGFFCEIQVRTLYQNRWAQLFEGLGDRWGRQIRYGKAPDDPHATISVEGASVTQPEIIQDMIYISDEIAEAESFESYFEEQETNLALDADGLGSHDFLRRQHDLQGLKREVHQRFERVDSFFKALSTVVPDSNHMPLHFEPGAPGEDGPLSAFLVAYRRSKGQLLEAASFPDGQIEVALERRRAFEERYRGDNDVEVVLLAAKSEATIRDTHSRYFERLEELATKLTGNDKGS